MKKKATIMIGLAAVLGIGGYLIYMNVQKSKPLAEGEDIGVGGCKGGQIPCPNNPAKCYDQWVTYITSPCTA